MRCGGYGSCRLRPRRPYRPALRVPPGGVALWTLNNALRRLRLRVADLNHPKVWMGNQIGARRITIYGVKPQAAGIGRIASGLGSRRPRPIETQAVCGQPAIHLYSYSSKALLHEEALTSFSVTTAARKRPVTFRTRKLSLPAPMVLPGGPGGRVGRRRIQPKGPFHISGTALFASQNPVSYTAPRSGRR